MSCYFLVDVYVDEAKGRGLYDDYIAKVKPIVEKFGGKYLARTEKVISLNPLRKPQRVIMIRFRLKRILRNVFPQMHTGKLCMSVKIV